MMWTKKMLHAWQNFQAIPMTAVSLGVGQSFGPVSLLGVAVSDFERPSCYEFNHEKQRGRAVSLPSTHSTGLEPLHMGCIFMCGVKVTGNL